MRASRTLNRGAGERSFPIGDSLNVRVPGRGGSKGERPRRGPGGQALAAFLLALLNRAFYLVPSFSGFLAQQFELLYHTHSGASCHPPLPMRSMARF